MTQELKEKIAEECYWQYMGMDVNWHPFAFADASETIRKEVYERTDKFFALIEENYVSKEEIEKLEVIGKEEIRRVAYRRNSSFEAANFAYTRKIDADECIAQAELQDVKDTLLGKKG